MDEEEKKPKDGDRIVHCGHKDIGRHFWFWLGEEGMRFKRPDGTDAIALWAFCCKNCFVQSKGDFKSVVICADGVWRGDAVDAKEPNWQ